MISAANAIQVTFYVDKTLKGAKLGESRPIRLRSVCAELRSILVARADGVIEYVAKAPQIRPPSNARRIWPRLRGGRWLICHSSGANSLPFLSSFDSLQSVRMERKPLLAESIDIGYAGELASPTL
jgi:hypothetical protein